jgi:serine/threonine protein kinase
LTKADLVVFYSLTARKWKVGDFGLTAEGFSEMQKTTQYGRGTQGYRAPELLLRLDFEAEEKSFYSKKSDVWALGCVFYEATFSKKLFKQDIETHGWAMSGRELELPISDLRMDPVSATRTEVLLGRMLSFDPVRRPAAKELCEQTGYWGDLSVPVLHPLFLLPMHLSRSSYLAGFIIGIDFGTHPNQMFNQCRRNDAHEYTVPV